MAVPDSSLIPDFSQLQLELVGISEGHRGLSRLFGLHFPSIFDDMRFVLDIRYLQSCQLYLTSIATASCRNAASERKEGCVFAWSHPRLQEATATATKEVHSTLSNTMK